MTGSALLRIGLPPRMLKESAAAEYCGLTIDLFRAECPVKPTKIRNRVLYDRKLIDLWLDQRGGVLPQSSGADYLGRLDGDGGDAHQRH